MPGVHLYGPGSELWDFVATLSAAAQVEAAARIAADALLNGAHHRQVGWFITNGLTPGNVAALDGYILLGRLHLYEAIPIDQVQMYVAVAVAGSTVTPVIYASLASGAPGAKLWEGTAQDTSTIGVKTLTPTLTLPAGRLWVGARASGGAPTVTGGFAHASGASPTSSITEHQGALSVLSAITDPAPTAGLATYNGAPADVEDGMSTG